MSENLKMDHKRIIRLRKHLLLALKIGVGSSLAIWIAGRLNLENAVSAGTITLLTLMTTKWETVRLSFYRIVTFLISVMAGWIVFLHIGNVTAAYGVYIFLTVLIAELFGLRTTISVNAVVGAHLLITHDFSRASILNEFILVLIGIVLALILNQFHDNRSHRKSMIADMRRTEEGLTSILQRIALYLLEPGAENIPETESQAGVWSDIRGMELLLQGYIRDAKEYRENSFQSHPVYYVDYFEMRYDQCQILYSLHASMKKIRSAPSQAIIVSDFILYLANHIVEKNNPERQEERLAEIFRFMREEDLPGEREEFESRALLYHILMDLETFIACKREFVEELDDQQLERYWHSVV